MQCVPHVDAEVLASLLPRVVDLLKSGIGLATKVAAHVEQVGVAYLSLPRPQVSTAQFVISLSLHCRDDLTPYSGELGLIPKLHTALFHHLN